MSCRASWLSPTSSFELEGQLATVGPEFEHVLLDLHGQAVHHLEPLRHGERVAQRDDVLDLDHGQLPGHLVEAGLVALECRDGLVGPGQDGRGVVDDVAATVDVHADDAHRLADRNHRISGLDCGAFRGAVPGAGLHGGDARIGHELHVGTHDARTVGGHDHGAVHLRQLPKPGGGELDVEFETAVAQLGDLVVETEDDQAARAAAEDAFETVA